MVILSLQSYSQGIRGKIFGSDGKPLPYASVFITDSQSGTSANANGEYQVRLPNGTHKIRIQNIGYGSQEAVVEVADGWTDRDFLLKVQDYLLQEVQVDKGRKQDYAYTIMRNAIAKSKFHRLQYKSYQMRVYVKGTGELLKAPFFVKGKLKKEGVKLNEAYTSESVSIVSFSQPDKVTEKVIAVRSTGENSGAGSPSMFISETFYQDKVANILSPLSRSAFQYYSFRYEGSFTEGKDIINKIRVIPKSKGDNIFDGHIYIVEDEWAIHSVNLRTSLLGFPILVKQNFAEVAPRLWLPVHHQYEFAGSVLGFAGHYKYIASCSQFKVVIDEKLKAEAQVIATVPTGDAEPAVRQEPNGQPVTRRQFRKMIDEYEKESLRQQKNPKVVAERTIETDTLAHKKDSTFWTEERSTPLTEKEIQGYRRDDSLAKASVAKEAAKDSSRVGSGKFNGLQLITGGSYRIDSLTRISIHPTLKQFYYNTVEGFNINFSAELRKSFENSKRKLSFTPSLRYGLASERFYAKAKLEYGTRANSFSFEGGSFVSQFNPEDPIHPLVNSITSLISRRNFMKIYQKDYLRGAYSYKPSPFLSLTVGAEFARRTELFNNTNYSFFRRESRAYTDNRPENIELGHAGFQTHNAVITDVMLRYRPGEAYKLYNGRKVPLFDRSPEFLLHYRKGIAGLADSKVDFDQLEIGINHSFPAGLGSVLSFELRGGAFLNNKQTYLMDYKHFDANRTFLGSLKPAGSFRLLDYYNYSTDNTYLSANVYYQLRKLLITRIPEVRLAGLKESLFVNYLKTKYSPHYYELGYSLDNVFRIFRIELAASFEGRHYHDKGIRLGIASMFQVNGR
ncbi:carboxypeptidase-like protein [Arcticibacter pallidicorallinus]|uniref:Carboxypeptidase-like protein n=1 Tax=Arcticibacter pallidicorallinus TaxID=1259464 RepID=A0A2T0TV08_9SPHI|nr:DUF5686 and carboxypeptidase regulatory-like domain-containing protein [Arcticibacter pallidicorallinus]PRY49524.1 carboxypeptidase-like protein [Arcticibacter pallidicorallinus]